MGDSTDAADTDRISDSSSGRPHPTPPPSTTTTTKPIEDMDATTMPETNVPLIPTEPHIATMEDTKIITEQTTEDFMNTKSVTQDSTDGVEVMEDFMTTEPVIKDSTYEVESMSSKSVMDDSSGTVSGRAGSQSGVIAGTVLAVFLAIFLMIFTAIFVLVVMSKKQNRNTSLARTNQQLQDISNGNSIARTNVSLLKSALNFMINFLKIAGNCAALNNPIYDCANEEPSHTHTDEHFQDISNGKYNTDNVIFMSYLITSL